MLLDDHLARLSPEERGLLRAALKTAATRSPHAPRLAALGFLRPLPDRPGLPPGLYGPTPLAEGLASPLRELQDTLHAAGTPDPELEVLDILDDLKRTRADGLWKALGSRQAVPKCLVGLYNDFLDGSPETAIALGIDGQRGVVAMVDRAPYTPARVLEALKAATGETGFLRCADAFGGDEGDVAYAAWSESDKRAGWDRHGRVAWSEDVRPEALEAMADALWRLASAKARGPLPEVEVGQKWYFIGGDERLRGRYVAVAHAVRGEIDEWAMHRDGDGKSLWMTPRGMRIGAWVPDPNNKQNAAADELRARLRAKGHVWQETKGHDGALLFRWPGPVHDYLAMVKPDGETMHY